MKWTSVILILSVGYALTHDAVSHEGGGKTPVKHLSHHEHEHSHGAHHQTTHGSDHYGDMHDHQLEPLLVKKVALAQQRVGCIQIALAAFMAPDSMNAAAGLTNIHPAIYDTESSLPGYVRAQILLL